MGDIVVLILILIIGWFIGEAAGWIKIPKLIGLILLGVLIKILFNSMDNFDLDFFDKYDYYISSIAISVVILKAGLNVDLAVIKGHKKTSIKLGFIPLLCEFVAIYFFAIYILNYDLESSLFLAAIIASVSPAIIIPLMEKINKKGYGKRITTINLIATSIDDAFALTIFAIIAAIFIPNQLVPSFGMIQIVFLILSISSFIIMYFFKRNYLIVKNSFWVGILFTAFFIILSFAKPIAIFVILILGIYVKNKPKNKKLILDTEMAISNVWLIVQIPLFVSVGWMINFSLFVNQLILGLFIIVGGISFRVLGIFISTFKSGLPEKEVLFLAISSIPKATVQASIGALPIAYGVFYGEEIFGYAVISIVFMAPIGYWIIEYGYKKMLVKEK